MMRAAGIQLAAMLIANSAIVSHAFGQSPDYMFEKVPARYALVVGNAAYDKLPPIPSASTDAQKMAEKLTALHFKVTRVDHVASVRDFEDNDLAPFRKPIDPGDIVLFYFSGHGFGYGAHNYVAPADMPLSVLNDQIPDAAISLEDVQSYLAARNPGLVIILVDACRSIAGFVINRKNDNNENLVLKGTARQVRPSNLVNTLVGYAAKSGYSAAGYSTVGVPSLFTGALVNYVDSNARDFGAIFHDASTDVVTETGGEQWPGMEDWSNTDLYLRASASIEAQEKEMWLASLSEGTRKAVIRFSNRHSVSRYAAAARKWLDDNPDDPPAAKFTYLSPAVIERAWNIHDDQLAIQPSPDGWAFERSLSGEAIEKLRDFSNVQLGIADAVAVSPYPSESQFARQLRVLQAHDTLIATKTLESRDGPSFASAATSQISPGTPVKIDGFEFSENGQTWLMGRTPNSSTVQYFPVAKKATRPYAQLRKALIEIQTPPRKAGVPDLVEAGPIQQAVKSIRKTSEKVTWVSLTVAKTDDAKEADARLARQTHAVYLLKQAGIDERRITAAGPSDDVSGDGVRVRFFGY